MVRLSSTLDRTFAAVSDPTRRAILDRLRRQQPMSIGELAQPFPVSLPAILKHVNVLSAAGLVECEKQGRTVTCRLSARPMREAVRWMERYQRYWTRKLDRLAAFVERESHE
jgi:DNA-binding transcriptional ArsR family regulator